MPYSNSIGNDGYQNRLPGLVSKQKTDDLINYKLSGETSKIRRVNDSIQLEEKTLVEYRKLQTQLIKLKDTSDALRTPSFGRPGSALDVFATRSPSISMNNGNVAAHYFIIKTEINAPISSYELTIEQLARPLVQRTSGFRSDTMNVVDSNSPASPGRFAAGNFQIISGQIGVPISPDPSALLTTNTLANSPINVNLLSTSFSTTGSVGSTVLNPAYGNNGIGVFSVTNTGDYGLIGSASSLFSSLQASQSGGSGNPVTLQATISGKTYLSNALLANTGTGANQIADGTIIIFTESVSGTSFSVETQAVTIDTNNALIQFANDVQSDMNDIDFYQTRSLINIDNARIAETFFSGLTSQNFLLTSDAFDPVTGDHGILSAFSGSAVSMTGAGDGTLSFSLYGENYVASGLGAQAGDTQTAAIIFSSQTTPKKFQIDINTANLSLSFANQANVEGIIDDINTIARTLGSYRIEETLAGSIFDTSYGTGGIDLVATNGDKYFVGNFKSILTTPTATQPLGIGSPVTVTLTVNGQTYTSNLLQANAGVNANQIDENTIVSFSNNAANTVFSLKTLSPFTINASSDLTIFGNTIQFALQGNSMTIYQFRPFASFSNNQLTGSVLQGLTPSNFLMYSDTINPSSSEPYGMISSFIINPVSANNAGDGKITVSVSGESFVAENLGATAGNLQKDNIILRSVFSDREIDINIADAGITLDFITPASVNNLQQSLNSILSTFVNITLQAGNSLLDIVSIVNGVSSSTGVGASITQVARQNNILSFQSKTPGISNSYAFLDPQNILSRVGLTTNQVAQDALITLNGISISRPTNSFSDVVKGVSLILLQPTPSGSIITFSITPNFEEIKNAIVGFTDAYGYFKHYVDSQNARDESSKNRKMLDSAILHRDITFQHITRSVQSIVTEPVEGLPYSNYNNLMALGIVMKDIKESEDKKIPAIKNALLIEDEASFKIKLSENIDQVRKVFAFDFSASSNKLVVASRSNGFKIHNFQLAIDITQPTQNQAIFNYKQNNLPISVAGQFNQTASGGVITGLANTPFQGLSFFYFGGGQDNITVNSMTQGVADKMYNLIEQHILHQNGSLPNAYIAHKKDISKGQDNLMQLQKEEAAKRKRLEEAQSKLEAATSKANNQNAFIEAMTEAMNKH